MKWSLFSVSRSEQANAAEGPRMLWCWNHPYWSFSCFGISMEYVPISYVPFNDSMEFGFRHGDHAVKASGN